MTGKRPVVKDIPLVPFLFCHSFVSSSLCRSPQIEEGEWVYLVCILYMSILTYNRK